MRIPLLLSALFMLLVSTSCKKSTGNEDDDPDETIIMTLEPEYKNANGVYGLEYTFKVNFIEVGKIKEYGVVYIPWIDRTDKKTPVYGEAGTFKMPFDTKAPGGPGIQTHTITMRYADFNNANYRAYAILSNGTVVYGDVKNITFA